jgi:hypothetical protein
MALNPDDRCGSAEEFRDALLRVDYSRWAVANEFALAIPPQTVNTVSVSTTMTAPAKPKQRIVVDNLPKPNVVDNVFKHNSVFQAVEKADGLLPEPSRAPAFAVAIFAFMLLSFVGIRYNVGEWLLGDSADEAKKESVLTASEKPTEQTKTYRSDNRSIKRSLSAGKSREIPRRNERPRRVNRK